MLCLFATIPCEQQNLQDPDILHQLLQQISAQDRDSLAELYRRTRTAVYAFALSYLKNGQDALNGAKDIIAEIISDNYDFRKFIREYIFENGILQTQGESEERTQYEIYYEYSEKLKTIPSHRILAINRGEKENILKVKVNFEEDVIVDKIYSKMKNENKETSKIIFESIEDSLKRLIIPSVIREIRKE